MLWSSCAGRGTRPGRSGGRRHAARAGARASPARRAPGCAPSASPGGTRRGSPPARSVALVPLLEPWVSVYVIAGRLPETRLVLLHHLQAVDPLRRLPEVQVGNEHPGRPAVLRLKILAVELISDPRLPVQQIFQRYVGGVPPEAVHHGVVRSSLDVREQRVQRDAAPGRAELRPFRDTVDVGAEILVRQRGELPPVPTGLVTRLGGDGEAPAVERDARGRAGREHREVVGQILTGRQAGDGFPPTAAEPF